MKYIKLSFIVIIIAVFIYYKFNTDDNILFEDKLSMFIIVSSHANIDDILFDLSSQIESFDEYIYNVYYSRDNDFLIKNKLKSQFDLEYINYKNLFTSSDIIDFNVKLADLIEEYFLDHNSSLHLTKRYLLRDFIIRFNNYFKNQINLFKKQKLVLESENSLEDFILGSKYFSDYDNRNYIIRIEFSDLESVNKYKEAGMDSVLNSILNYNSKVFQSELLLYGPSLDSNLEIPLEFELKQYVNEFDSVEEAIKHHKDLMLSDNIYLIESIYDYHYESSRDFKSPTLKLHPSLLDSNYQIDYMDYKNSLLILEEKLIALQMDDLTDDPVITKLLIDLIGDGSQSGFYSNYINLINPRTNYLIVNLNRLFAYELQSLFEQFDQSESIFDITDLPENVIKHLFSKDKFKVRYFTK